MKILLVDNDHLLWEPRSIPTKDSLMDEANKFNYKTNLVHVDKHNLDGWKILNDQDRVVAMCATNGLTRGIEVIDMGASLSTPVGRATAEMNSQCSRGASW